MAVPQRCLRDARFQIIFTHIRIAASPMVLLSCPSTGTTARASSVLNNSKLYGAINALDSSDASSCWNSEGVKSGESTASAFTLNFGRVVEVNDLRIQFQGGFVARDCAVSVALQDGGNGRAEWTELDEAPVEAEDTNELQCFDLTDAPPSKRRCNMLKLEFDESTDFYGRITIYRLEVWGSETS